MRVDRRKYVQWYGSEKNEGISCSKGSQQECRGRMATSVLPKDDEGEGVTDDSHEAQAPDEDRVEGEIEEGTAVCDRRSLIVRKVRTVDGHDALPGFSALSEVTNQTDSRLASGSSVPTGAPSNSAVTEDTPYCSIKTTLRI